MTAPDRARARRLVRASAKLVKAQQASSWLFDDPKGTWEQTALTYLERASANTPGASASQVDEATTVQLAYLAVEACLRSARRPR
jgi:hypothetical protein